MDGGGSMIETIAILTCPHCKGYFKVEMPTDRCQIVLQCLRCGKNITPKEGDCCVFCSYADNKCPTEQEEELRIMRNANLDINNKRR